MVLLAVAGYLLRRPSATGAGGHAFPVPTLDRRVQVEVLNATRRQGYARAATRMLRRRGLDVVFLGNADSLVDSTRVIVRRGGTERGRLVAQALGVSRVVVALDTLRRVDVSVLLGDDFRPATGLHP